MKKNSKSEQGKGKRQGKTKGKKRAKDKEKTEIVEWEGLNPHENILLKTDALKSTRGLSL
jgi:hypothetical protein